MKKVMWLVVVGVVVLPLIANAGEIVVGNPGGWAGGQPGGVQKAGMWRQLTYDARCPASIALLDRLGLSEDQQKVLDDIYEEWSGKQNKAYGDAKAKIGKLSAEDQKDPQKVKDYMARRTAAFNDAQIPIPVDQVRNILSPEQTQKLDEAAKVLAEWSKWLTDYLSKYNKQLDEILGAPPETRDQWLTWKYAALNNYLKGAADLGDRIGLTKEQEAALQKLYNEYQAELAAMMAPASAALSSDNAGKEPKDYAGSIRTVLYAECQKVADEKLRLAIEKLLTQDQRDTLAKAMGVVQERDKGLAENYVLYAAKVNKIVPPPARKAGDPIIMRAPGGGVSIIMPDRKAGADGEGRTIVLPGGGVELCKAGAGGGTVIIIGEGGEDKD